MTVISIDFGHACVFHARLRAGVWGVTKNDAPYREYLSRAAAVAGACAAARDVEAVGGSARVLYGAHDELIGHQE